MAYDKHFVTLGDAINQFLEKNNLQSKINEVKLLETWEVLVGKAIKSHTIELFIKDKTLYVKVDSSVVRQEINFMRRRLADKINKAFNSNIIEQIIVL